ncbi:hypothetical protein Csa_023662, partial [Cucumis sativus]
QLSCGFNQGGIFVFYLCSSIYAFVCFLLKGNHHWLQMIFRGVECKVQF